MVLPYEMTEIRQPKDVMITLDALPQMICAKELKQLLGCGIHRAYDLMKCPAFPATKIGGRYYVERDALRSWLKRYQGRKIIL